jgi:Protein of unknown function (DUF4238)
MHHYIPRFYLSGFVDPDILDSEGKEVLWVYEREKQIRRSSPTNEARQRDYYGLVAEGSRNVEVETWLGNLENEVAPIIASIVKDRRHVTDAEKELLANFIGTMQGRTPAGRWFAENKVGPLTNQIIKEAAADSEKFRSFIEENYHLPEDEGVDLEEVRRDILAGRGEHLSARQDFKLISIIEVGKMVAEVLLSMNWQTIHSEEHEPFLTSDDPVISHVIDERANLLRFRMGVASPGANIWFPLSRTACLRMTKDSEAGVGQWVPAGIRYLNKMVIMCADRWVYASEQSAKIKSLFDRKGGLANVRTVDFRFEDLKY